jgi:hypothetical protein
MRQFHFYDEMTGLLHGNSIAVNVPDGHDAIAQRHCPPGHQLIEGNWHPLTHRVDIVTGQVIDYQPPQPSADHEWNAETKRWQLSAAAQAKIAARSAAAARIAALEASQTTWLRKHALGDPAAIGHLREIDDEIAVLSK